jgi:hypothetical protein
MPKVKVKKKKEKVAGNPRAVGSRRPPGDGVSVVAGAVPSAGATNGSGMVLRRALASSERQEDIPVAALPPGLGTAPATTDGTCSGETEEDRKKRRAREVSAKWQAELKAELAASPKPRSNPLLDLPEDQTEKLFAWLRECPYHDAVKQMLAEQGIAGVTDCELDQFFELEANSHWQRRLQRAATEANALVTYIEQHPVKFSAGILAALGQEAFRQIASGNVAPESMTRMTNLFLKARADERSDQLLDLRREKMELDRRTQTEAALEAFAAEIEKHPEARAAFEALRAELMRKEGE